VEALVTDAQLSAFLTIQHQIDRGKPVTYRWLAAELGLVSTGRVYDVVDALVDLGYLSRENRKIRLRRRISRIVEWRKYDPTTQSWETIERGRTWTGYDSSRRLSA